MEYIINAINVAAGLLQFITVMVLELVMIIQKKKKNVFISVITLKGNIVK